jgi:hypothetical protein
MTVLNGVLASGFLFFGVNYFILRYRCKWAESLNERYHLLWHDLDKVVDKYHWQWDATSTLVDKVSYLLDKKAGLKPRNPADESYCALPLVDPCSRNLTA